VTSNQVFRNTPDRKLTLEHDTDLVLCLEARDDGRRDYPADAAAVDAQHRDELPLRRRPCRGCPYWRDLGQMEPRPRRTSAFDLVFLISTGLRSSLPPYKLERVTLTVTEVSNMADQPQSDRLVFFKGIVLFQILRKYIEV
jgi:hypothetical protein